jgi:hypothetical protein
MAADFSDEEIWARDVCADLGAALLLLKSLVSKLRLQSPMGLMQTDIWLDPSRGLDVVLKGCHSMRETPGMLRNMKLKALWLKPVHRRVKEGAVR